MSFSLSPGKPGLAKPGVRCLGRSPGQKDGQSIASTQQDLSEHWVQPLAKSLPLTPSQSKKPVPSMRF